ncbi:MAG: multi-sensor hybrid histidine kinase [Labilithrix sp.]|nr:multi-sensor hybrid histidine kinase [Labilithrix sp.]
MMMMIDDELEDMEDEEIEGDLGERAFRLRDVRVLVVEDEPETRELLAEVFERIGAQVLALPCAEDALRDFGSFGPDLVLSDLSLPQLDGLEMLKRIRQTPAGATIPAMALSASASLEDAARAIDAGFDAHVAKPLSSEALVRAVLSIVDVRRRVAS